MCESLLFCYLLYFCSVCAICFLMLDGAMFVCNRLCDFLSNRTHMCHIIFVFQVRIAAGEYSDGHNVSINML